MHTMLQIGEVEHTLGGGGGGGLGGCVTRQDGSLDGSTVGDSLVGVDGLVGLGRCRRRCGRGRGRGEGHDEEVGEGSSGLMVHAGGELLLRSWLRGWLTGWSLNSPA